jgi:hypothetical protein
MKKIVIAIIAVAFMHSVSMGSNDNRETIKNNNLTEEINSNNNDDDWTKIGTTQIYKKVGANGAAASQTVQVYRNSNGTRAIKNGNRYEEFEENPMYNRFPADECFECGYSYRVFYEGSYWYTKGIVKKTYGSY